jgi:glyoxylase-like metal-dependent hydrolase (beta-lactamase superfamily II)
MNEQERETSALLCTYYGCERSVSLERLHGFGFSPAQANRILERAFLPDYHYHDYNWRDFPIHNGAVGQHFVCGTYDFEVISLAGHTKHQLGLAERTHKWLFAGDTISRNEVLILSAMAPGDHLLDRQMETLDTLNREFSDYWVVSGHCNPFHGTEKSIANTKRYFAHITDRIAQLVSSEGTPLSLSQIVERLFRYKEGRMVEEESLKLHFRISNTLVCLECLTQQGVLFQTTHEGVTLWSPKNK